MSLTRVQATATAYVFYGTVGNSAYSLGYAFYEGIALACALGGSGSYQSSVPNS